MASDFSRCPVCSISCGRSDSQIAHHMVLVHNFATFDEAADALYEYWDRMALEELVAQVGKRAAGWTWETYPNNGVEGAVERVKRWADDGCPEWTVYLYGPTGSGKTGLAFCLTRHLAIWGSAEFVNVRRLLAALRQSFTNDEPIDDVARAIACKLLVLDDLGAERPTGFALDTIGLIVEARHAAAKTTIVTTNYAPAQLALRLGQDDLLIGQRIVSRLVEDAVKIHLDRPDLRVAHTLRVVEPRESHAPDEARGTA